MEVLKKAKERSFETSKSVSAAVADMIAEVRARGDEALLEYNARFDDCGREALRVTPAEVEEAYRLVSAAEVEDMRAAAANISAFAKAQRDSCTEVKAFAPVPGVTLGHRLLPIDACCCYVPGGNYPLYSSALMLAIPARVAGVKRVAACSPVVKGSNSIHPKTLVALNIAGVEEIYAVGGAHAVAAFAYGTNQIAPVDLIAGPGNAYVTEAKRQCYGQVGIDFLAGPSEVMVLADDSANAAVVAADLLAQSEHDRLAQGVLVTTSRVLGQEVLLEVERQLQNLETAAIARDAWEAYGEVLLVENLEEAVKLANDRAPEHLEVQTRDDEAVAAQLRNYGSLFLGQYAAEVFGDYTSGTNHTLPTMRAARYTGGVWVGTFLKTCTYQRFSKEAMQTMAPLTARMARGEGLAAHARAAQERQERL